MPSRLVTALAAMVTAVMVGMIVGLVAMRTTTVSAATFTYDAHVVEFVGEHAFAPLDASAAEFSAAREWSDSSPVEARGTSTTSSTRSVATESVPLYRAVLTAERADLAAGNGFRGGPNSYEGKLFATTPEDAAGFGRINDSLSPGGEPFHIVETRVPGSSLDSFEHLTMNGMPAVHVPEAQLGELGPPAIWDSVPWAPKGVQ